MIFFAFSGFLIMTLELNAIKIVFEVYILKNQFYSHRRHSWGLSNTSSNINFETLTSPIQFDLKYGFHYFGLIGPK